jgi:hypothetical protein
MGVATAVAGSTLRALAMALNDKRLTVSVGVVSPLCSETLVNRACVAVDVCNFRRRPRRRCWLTLIAEALPLLCIR